MDENGDKGPHEAAVDTRRIQAKLEYVRRESAAAANTAARILERAARMATDSDAAAMLGGVKYSLQTAIQAMVDIAYHLAAKAFGVAPPDAYAAFDVLAHHGVIPADRLGTYRQMLGVRNRLVHGYADVEDGRMLDFALSTTDFDAFRQEVQEFVSRQRRDDS